MQPSIPNANAVDSAFRRLAGRLRNARKKINVAAAKQMKSDKYEAAQNWMEIGRAVADFAERVNAFAGEWKRLTKATRIAARAESEAESNKLPPQTMNKNTPTWKVCEPALKVLAGRGGTATLEELVPELEKSLTGTLTESDLALVPSRGVPRWHITLKRAYRHCQREGWIEKHTGGVWKITSKGKAVVV